MAEPRKCANCDQLDCMNEHHVDAPSPAEVRDGGPLDLKIWTTHQIFVLCSPGDGDEWVSAAEARRAIAEVKALRSALASLQPTPEPLKDVIENLPRFRIVHGRLIDCTDGDWLLRSEVLAALSSVSESREPGADLSTQDGVGGWQPK